MTDEEIQGLKDATLAAETRAADAETAATLAREEAEKSKAALLNNVEELKAERLKKQEALGKLNINNSDPVDVETLVEAALRKREEDKQKTELELAIAEFKASKPEFQSDSAGIVFDKFKQDLSRFNLSGVTTKAEAKARLEEVYRFVNFKQGTEDNQPYNGSTRGTPNIADNSGDIRRDVTELIDSVKMEKDDYVKLKTKYPEAFESLGL